MNFPLDNHFTRLTAPDMASSPPIMLHGTFSVIVELPTPPRSLQGLLRSGWSEQSLLIKNAQYAPIIKPTQSTEFPCPKLGHKDTGVLTNQLWIGWSNTSHMGFYQCRKSNGSSKNNATCSGTLSFVISGAQIHRAFCIVNTWSRCLGLSLGSFLIDLTDKLHVVVLMDGAICHGSKHRFGPSS